MSAGDLETGFAMLVALFLLLVLLWEVRQ